MAFGVDTEVPNTRVILRQPDVIVNRSLIPIQPVAEFALSASYAQSASYVFGAIETASYALYAVTASYVSGAASNWDTLTNKPQGLVSSSTQILNYNLFATTGSNIFTGNQTFTGNILISGSNVETVFSSSVPLIVHEDIQARGIFGEVHLMVDEIEPHLEIYAPSENSFYENAEFGTYQLFLYNTASGYFGFALDGIRAGYTGWDGPIIGGDNGSGGPTSYPAFIGFQNAQNYTDGRITTLTPLSASAGITGSLFGTSSLATNAISASYAQNANLLDGLNSTVFATTGSNTFTSTQTIAGNLFLSSSFPLVYNNNSANNMLFGFFDGGSIYGAYYQIFGNTYSNISQRGGAEFVYDTRNNSDANFHIASFNGATWTEKFRVDDNGVYITGSLNVSGSDISVLDLHSVSDYPWLFRLFNDSYNLSQSVFAGWVENNGTAYIGNEVNTPINIYTDAQYSIPNLQISSSGLTIQPGLIVTGSLNVSSGITGSLYGTASWATNAISSSFASFTSNATSASYVEYSNVANKPTIVSSSLQINTGSFSGSFTGALIGTSSWATNVISASYASNAELLDGFNSTAFATTGSNTFNGNQTISGSVFANIDTLILTGSMSILGTLSVSDTISGSLFGTASYAVTASYIDGGYY